MAGEVTFAKSFLSLLDSKPPKISPDHIEDPRSYPGHSPYTLSRLSTQKPFSKRSSAANAGTTATSTTSSPSDSISQRKTNPGAEPALSVTLRSPRNPPFDLTLPAVPHSTSLAEVKERVAAETGIPLDKIKLLHGKKPVGDTKVLKDLVGSNAGGVELGVMVLAGGASHFKMDGREKGGAASADAVSASVAVAGEGAAVAQGLQGISVLETEQFWGELKGYLQQRVRDEAVVEEALGLFKAAWSKRSG
ncbi:cell-cycle control medial ring component [Dichotomopilus funicola]|uniref:Cell-cycle control medial ring component n=1 Tax=Dichotomopilus funicola TaxID=1934379 RepID=A0AAN6V473_9PEZI|nr:cell-cycle control medial ring component [Dichotomopilus funicola]